jgi:hypothetical protein
MNKIIKDVIGGFNKFLEDQQSVPGDCTITLVQFNHEYEVLYQAMNINNAKLLDRETFVPRGYTALLDAIGRTIHNTGKRLGELPEAERPEKVIFVILTDGEENYSKEFTLQQINEMIRHQLEKYAWEFVFLGANQDAIAVAGMMGIHAANALTYAADPAGTQDAFGSASSNIASYRKGTTRGAYFSDDDRSKQKRPETN